MGAFSGKQFIFYSHITFSWLLAVTIIYFYISVNAKAELHISYLYKLSVVALAYDSTTIFPKMNKMK